MLIEYRVNTTKSLTLSNNDLSLSGGNKKIGVLAAYDAR